MRIRQIKPAICCNEDIAALGPYAYILFTGLWMLADREGRFEWRPKRIKALVMPLWEECGWKEVENLLEKLMESGFIHRYEVNGAAYGRIQNFAKHQHVHPKESASELPPPPDSSGPESVTSQETRKLPGITRTSRVGPTSGLTTSESGVEDALLTVCESVQKSLNFDSTTTPSKTETPTQRKQPARETGARGTQDETTIRASLAELARLCRLPPADDGIVRRVLDAGRGHSGGELHALLVDLYKRGKLRDMRSWGLIPMLVGQRCNAA